MDYKTKLEEIEQLAEGRELKYHFNNQDDDVRVQESFDEEYPFTKIIYNEQRNGDVIVIAFNPKGAKESRKKIYDERNAEFEKSGHQPLMYERDEAGKVKLDKRGKPKPIIDGFWNRALAAGKGLMGGNLRYLYVLDVIAASSPHASDVSDSITADTLGFIAAFLNKRKDEGEEPLIIFAPGNPPKKMSKKQIQQVYPEIYRQIIEPYCQQIYIVGKLTDKGFPRQLVNGTTKIHPLKDETEKEIKRMQKAFNVEE